jgi:Tol biopolymer transport system component
MTIRSFTIGLVAACVLVAGLAAEQVSPRRFGFDDFSKVRRVSEPQFSPDAATIAFLVSTPNLDENRHVASLQRIDVASGRMEQLVSGDDYVGVSFPRYAPDGNRIAFLAYAKGATTTRPQIFVVSSRGGAPTQLTTTATGVQQLAWSPDSRTIGFATVERFVRRAAKLSPVHDGTGAADARVDGVGFRR